jgi:cytochrome P450
MLVRESHQDERVFPSPRSFDPLRFADRNPTRSEYAPFGAFRLACIGEDVSKGVAVTFALELATGFAWRVLDDGPPEINDWVHNAPSPRLTVAIEKKPALARSAVA